MIKHFTLFLAAATTLAAACQSPSPAPLKPRVVVLTDIGPAEVEPDDNESAVRLLAYEHKFYPDEFNDFAARMQWAAEGRGNRNPVVVINGKQGHKRLRLENGDGLAPLPVTARPGASLNFDASASSDPDGDPLRFEWWFQEFPGQMSTLPAIAEPATPVAAVTIPANAAPGQQYHLVCEVHDTGPFALPAYRRIIITVE